MEASREKQQRHRNLPEVLWTDSQDYGADEISDISKTPLFHKTTQSTSEITTLLRVSPQIPFLTSHLNEIPRIRKIRIEIQNTKTAGAHVKICAQSL